MSYVSLSSTEEHLSVHGDEENDDQTHGNQEQEQETEEHEQQESGQPETLAQEQEQYGGNQPTDDHVSKSLQQEVPEQGVPDLQQDESEGAPEDDASYGSDKRREYVNDASGVCDVLAADEVHHSANPEEDADYIEQKETAPDDFGEDLSEGFGGDAEGDAEERQAFDDAVDGDAHGADPVSPEGIDVLETPAFLADFTTIPEDQYDAGVSIFTISVVAQYSFMTFTDHRDDDGFSDTGETLPTDMSTPIREDYGMHTLFFIDNIVDVSYHRTCDYRYCREC